MPIRILTVDDHPLLREGIAAVIEGQPDMQLVGEAASGLEALQVFRDCRPDVTLMDLQMPGMGGVEAIGALHREFPQAKVVVLTTYQGDAQALRAFKAGAAGYLLKSMLRREPVDTIRSVHAGRRRMPPEIAAGSRTIAFGDYSNYWIADRQGVSMKRLNELYAVTGQVGFLATKRVDGRVIMPEGINLLAQHS